MTAAVGLPTVKCLVWDLDDTLWDGVVLEGDRPKPFAAALRTLDTLDGRGILHAVASRGERDVAERWLEECGLADRFVALEIGWGAKSDAVAAVAESLNIGIDTLAFIDNDAFERGEVAAAHPTVRCYPADQVGALPDLDDFRPPFVTSESRQRRAMYQAEQRRKAAEESTSGSQAEFLASLGLTLTVRRARPGDLERAHELTVRTHQLNSTGLTFSLEELRDLAASPRHEVLVARLTDRFGSYGTIGLAVSDLLDGEQRLRLLLMSCRVLSRGMGRVLIGHIVRRARAAGRVPRAEFVSTAHNRITLVTLGFAGFVPVERDGDRMLLEHRPDRGEPDSPHVRVIDEDTDAGTEEEDTDAGTEEGEGTTT
ncbi:HAD-IIIC family phosphatase [Streptomyces achromogenes]|uniref:HAD-IIIC family phosphatase n=1 Tax=Streptomyces achromogenes TaxID=67255 RepID=UPI00069256EF|nr:HAD-IIIC family phosphatase [Streptomyces achromogenes]